MPGPTIEYLRDHELSLMTQLQFFICLVLDRLKVELLLFNVHRPPIIFIRLIKQIQLNVRHVIQVYKRSLEELKATGLKCLLLVALHFQFEFWKLLCLFLH